MKKIIAFMIVAAMCFVLAACGNRVTAERSDKESSTAESSENLNTDIGQNTEAESVDLTGPWHLDPEKNDIRAIEAAWETFPGYGEWGAAMEIGSDGQMSWYIGAVGASGSYTVEGDILHAELTDTMEQKEVSMDFVIVGKDTMKMTYADTELIWVYGA